MDNKLIVLMAARACDEKKAKEIKLINIDKVSYISEWILIAEGLSDVQVRSITNSVEVKLREKVMNQKTLQGVLTQVDKEILQLKVKKDVFEVNFNNVESCKLMPDFKKILGKK